MGLATSNLHNPCRKLLKLDHLWYWSDYHLRVLFININFTAKLWICLMLLRTDQSLLELSKDEQLVCLLLEPETEVFELHHRYLLVWIHDDFDSLLDFLRGQLHTGRERDQILGCEVLL